MYRAVILCIVLSIAACATAPSPKLAQIPLEYYDLDELTLLSTSPDGPDVYAVFLDSRGYQQRARLRQIVATNDLKLLSIQKDSVTLGKMVPCDDGSWAEPPLYGLKIRARAVPLPLPADNRCDMSSGPGLGPDQWPTTLQDTVRMIISRLSEDDKITIRNTKKDDLVQFYMGWGTGIRNYYGLWRGNSKLRLSACGQPCEPEAASVFIIRAVWQELQK